MPSNQAERSPGASAPRAISTTSWPAADGRERRGWRRGSRLSVRRDRCASARRYISSRRRSSWPATDATRRHSAVPRRRRLATSDPSAGRSGRPGERRGSSSRSSPTSSEPTPTAGSSPTRWPRCSAPRARATTPPKSWPGASWGSGSTSAPSRRPRTRRGSKPTASRSSRGAVGLGRSRGPASTASWSSHCRPSHRRRAGRVVPSAGSSSRAKGGPGRGGDPRRRGRLAPRTTDTDARRR